jgi:hypothetical protein
MKRKHTNFRRAWWAAISLLFALPAFAAHNPGWRSYGGHGDGYAISFPVDARVHTNVQVNAYNALIRVADISGALASANYKGTNLRDASVSLAVSRDTKVVSACSAGKAANGESAEGSIMLDGVPFFRFASDDAGAGSRWQWTIYRAVHNGACYEIVESMVWGAIENYPVGAVKPFDRQHIESRLHAISQSFRFPPQPLQSSR